jgi:hypothetical protein
MPPKRKRRRVLGIPAQGPLPFIEEAQDQLKLKAGSSACSKTEIDFFTLPPTQVVIEKVIDQQFRPVNSLQSGGVIRLELPKSDHYMDLSSFHLYVRGKVIKLGGGNLPAPANVKHTEVDLKNQLTVTGKKVAGGADGTAVMAAIKETNVKGPYFVAPINSPLFGLFNYCDVYFNGQLVSVAGQRYNFRCHMETLLNNSNRTKDELLKTEGWAKDTARHMEPTADNATANTGFKKRAEIISESKTWEYYSRLHGDVFNTGVHEQCMIAWLLDYLLTCLLVCCLYTN